MILFKFIFKHGIFNALPFFFLAGCTTFVTREYNLNNPFQDIITSESGIWGGVYGKAEFILEGYFSGYGALFLLDRKPEVVDSGEWDRYGLKYSIQGNFKERFVFMWYVDFVGVVFIPTVPGEGNLRLRFRRTL